MYLLSLRLYLYLDVPIAVRVHDEIETALIIKRVLLLVATHTRCRRSTRIKSKPLYCRHSAAKGLKTCRVLFKKQITGY